MLEMLFCLVAGISEGVTLTARFGEPGFIINTPIGTSTCAIYKIEAYQFNMVFG